MAISEPIPMTASAHTALKQELEELTTVRRPEVVARIATTREEGDLKENAGYHQAREDQSRLEGRINEITHLLKNAVLIEEGTSNGIARLGSAVTVSDELGESVYHLVGPVETDPTSGRISIESPVGKSLVGKSAGDTVTVESPGGLMTLTVVSVA